MEVLPDPSCRKYEHRPAGSGALWSAPLRRPTARSCGGPRSLPASEVAPAMSEACGRTSGCRTTRALLKLLTTIISNISSLKNVITSGQGSSWASEQRHHLPQGRRTCFHCSAASGQMSPTACCCRCWGRLLPGNLFSSTHPREKNKNNPNQIS